MAMTHSICIKTWEGVRKVIIVFLLRKSAIALKEIDPI
jgi:hypothetical protein